MGDRYLLQEIIPGMALFCIELALCNICHKLKRCFFFFKTGSSLLIGNSMHACFLFSLFCLCVNVGFEDSTRPVESSYSKSCILLVSIAKTYTVLLVG